MAHIADILEFLDTKTGKIAGNDDLYFSPAFDLREEGYGVTVILPKSLAEDGKVSWSVGSVGSDQLNQL